MNGLRIALVVGAPLGESLREALERLGARSDVVTSRDGGPLDAVVTDDPRLRPRATAVVRWVPGPAAPVVTEPAGAVALLASPPVARAVRATAAAPVLTLGSGPDVDPGRRARLVLPFTRARIRRARGLTGPGVARRLEGRWTWDGRAVPDADAATLVALAAVVVTDEVEVALLASAWGAAVVTTPEVAAATGIPLVADGSGTGLLEEAAAALLADAGLHAVHARRCHDRFQDDHSADRAVVRLTELLRAAGALRRPAGIGGALDSLGTSKDAAIRTRSHVAVDSLRR